MTDRRNPMVGVRLSQADVDAIDALAVDRGCSRAEAIRIALTFGIPLAQHATSVNIRRYASVMEFTAACLGVIIQRDYSDYADEVKDLVIERLEEYHG